MDSDERVYDLRLASLGCAPSVFGVNLQRRLVA